MRVCATSITTGAQLLDSGTNEGNPLTRCAGSPAVNQSVSVKGISQILRMTSACPQCYHHNPPYSLVPKLLGLREVGRHSGPAAYLDEPGDPGGDYMPGACPSSFYKRICSHGIGRSIATTRTGRLTVSTSPTSKNPRFLYEVLSLTVNSFSTSIPSPRR